MGLFDLFRSTPQGIAGYDPNKINKEIIRESLDIMYKTVNPETFFSREKLAKEKTDKCLLDREILWNGMNCSQIYQMLSDSYKREEWHKKFIDRLLERKCEDNLTYQMYDVSSYMSRETIDYFVRRLNGKKYHFCKVRFDGSDRLYTYVTKDPAVLPGDVVTVPGGNILVTVTTNRVVEEVFDASLNQLDFPVAHLRCILKRLTAKEGQQYQPVAQTDGKKTIAQEKTAAQEAPKEEEVSIKEPAPKADSTKTYPWEKFYPENVNDNTVELLIRGNLRLVQGKGVKDGELIDAMMDIEKAKHRAKVVTDLTQDGYKLQEKDIVEYFEAEGDDACLSEMVRKYSGTFRKETLMEFYTWGTDMRLNEILKKVPDNVEFTESEILELLNTISNDDTAGVRALLDRFNPKTIKRDTVIEICELVPNDVMGAVRKYLKLLPQKDRAEILEEYF